MENKYLALIIIGISIFTIISVSNLAVIDSLLSGTLVKTTPTTDLPLKNETFEGVKIAVPSDATFKNNTDKDVISPNSFECKRYEIYIETYITNLTKKDINESISSYIQMNNLNEIQLEGLPKNAKAYVNPAYNDTTEIIIINDEGNKAVILIVIGNEKYAVKMANSIVFPN
jgi:hypothetical protein